MPPTAGEIRIPGARTCMAPYWLITHQWCATEGRLVSVTPPAFELGVQCVAFHFEEDAELNLLAGELSELGANASASCRRRR